MTYLDQFTPPNETMDLEQLKELEKTWIETFDRLGILNTVVSLFKKNQTCHDEPHGKVFKVKHKDIFIELQTCKCEDHTKLDVTNPMFKEFFDKHLVHSAQLKITYSIGEEKIKVLDYKVNMIDQLKTIKPGKWLNDLESLIDALVIKNIETQKQEYYDIKKLF